MSNSEDNPLSKRLWERTVISPNVPKVEDCDQILFSVLTLLDKMAFIANIHLAELLVTGKQAHKLYQGTNE